MQKKLNFLTGEQSGHILIATCHVGLLTQ